MADKTITQLDAATTVLGSDLVAIVNAGETRKATVNQLISIFNSGIDGNGTQNQLAKFVGAGTIGDSQIVDDGSHVGMGTSTPTSRLDVAGEEGYNQLRLRTSYSPLDTSDANGNAGDVAWDNSYLYVKTNEGWKRAALSAF